MAKAIIDTLKATNSADEKVIVYPRTLVEAISDADGIALNKKLATTLKLPIDETGNPIYGEVGQVPLSDGVGGITWTTVIDGDEVNW